MALNSDTLYWMNICQDRKWVTGMASKLFYMAASVVTMSSFALFIAYSKHGRSDYPFIFTTVTMMMELTKFVISFGMYSIERWVLHSTDTSLLLDWKKSMHFAVPALCYVISNNLMFLILKVMDPSTFQVLVQIKIIMIALLSWIMLNRKINFVQWNSISVLCVGTALTQTRCEHVFDSSKAWGVILVLIQSAVASFANVYSELRLKTHHQDTINVQNMHLYFYGIFGNLLLFLLYDLGRAHNGGFFQGYTLITLCVILSGAVMGLFISVIMKQISNIARVFCNAFSIMFTAVIAVWLLDFRLDVFFIFATMLVIFSVALYAHEKNKTVASGSSSNSSKVNVYKPLSDNGDDDDDLNSIPLSETPTSQDPNDTDLLDIVVDESTQKKD